MTSRERLMNTIQGKPVDRMPVSPFIHTNFIYELFDIDADQGDKVDIVQKCIEANEVFGFDIMHRSAHLDFCSDLETEVSDEDGKWIVERELKEDNGRGTEITTISTPERMLRQIKEIRKINKYMIVCAINEYFIKENEDFEQFIKYQPALRKLKNQNIINALALINDKGIIVGHSSGVFNYLNVYRKLDDLLMDPLIDSGFYHDMASYFAGRLSEAKDQMMATGVEIINFDMNVASASMVSTDYFRKFIMPYESALMQRVKDKGKYTFVHNCGDARNLIPVYNEMPIDIYESLTQPPLGDTLLDEALKLFRRDITLCGNIDQVDFLLTATPEMVYEKTVEVVKKGRERGRFILGTSDFLSNGTPFENIHALVAAVNDFG